jgi:hypothetical protein
MKSLFAISCLLGMLLVAQPASAYEGPWCARINMGDDNSYDNCQMRSFEMCLAEVRLNAGGAVCVQNPRWAGPAPVRRGPGPNRLRQF